MVPTGIGAGLTFLVLIVPGFVLESLLLNRRPKRDESAFSEANRVVFSSLLSSGVSIVVVCILLFAVHQTWYNDLQLWLTTGKYPPALPIAIPYTCLFAEAMLAISFVWMWDHFWGEKLFGPRRLSTDSAWRRHLSDREPLAIPPPSSDKRSRDVFVQVELTSGRFIQGYVADFTPDHDWADRELSLTAPIYERDESRCWNYILPQVFIVPSTSVVSLSIFYGYLNEP